MSELSKWLNQIHHIDALELLAQLPDDSVDLVLTDPPYGLAGRIFNVPSKSYNAVNEQWDYDVPLLWLENCTRILKPNGTIICFGVRQSIYEVASKCLSLGYRIINDITWFKPDAMPNMTGRMMTESTERALWVSPSGKKWIYNLDYAKHINNGSNLRDVWTIGQTKEERYHPTQKPLCLIERIVNLLCEGDAVILDPFCGSGTTAIAARKLGRNFICGDITKEYVDIARKRLQDTDPYQPTELSNGNKQLSLFAKDITNDCP